MKMVQNDSFNCPPCKSSGILNTKCNISEKFEWAVKFALWWNVKSPSIDYFGQRWKHLVECLGTIVVYGTCQNNQNTRIKYWHKLKLLEWGLKITIIFYYFISLKMLKSWIVTFHIAHNAAVWALSKLSF